jgi:ribonuclease R
LSERPRRGAGLRSFRGAHVAEIERRGRFAAAVPLFERGPQIPLGRDGRDLVGSIALVEFGPGRGRVLHELGSAGVARDVSAALLWERGTGRGFRDPLEQDAREAVTAVAADPGPRRDLTGLATFTVDPASARDFDDAVSAQREGDGVRLWVHIADVSAHVRAGSPLDREALERANSTYVPGTVEPMLPSVLSDQACSLAPGVARLAVTAEVELGPVAAAGSARFYRSLIRSDARLDYDHLDRVFAGRETAPKEVVEPLATARAVAAGLGERRAGTELAVESREPEFEFDEAGNAVSARGVEQTEAHRLIERLMILANEQVAALLERRRAPTLYRVHEQPDPQRVEFMVEQLASLDLPTPPLPERMGPREAARLAGEASRMVAAEAARRGHGRSAYTSLVLRALKQAHYSDRNLGHAGLGSDAYCHFTSPIRRYPDLIAHRALLSVLGEGEEPPSRGAVAEAAVQCSERERASARIERDADDVCSAFLLERELFESGWETKFEGEVSGVIGAGAFVAFGGELADVYEGFLPARKLRGERFELNREETALGGTRTGRQVRLGDPVTIRVVGVESARGRVDLEPAEG